MGAARVCFTSTPVSSNPKNEIGPYKNYNVSRARSSRAGDLAASVPNPHPRYEPIPSEGVEKISEYLPTSVPAVNIEREPSSSPTTQACEKSKPIVDVSLERPISEGSDPNSPLRVNSGFSESGNMSGQLKLKVAKKRRKTRESSIPPSAKKRRSDCHSVIRLQMRSLLGLDTADSSHKIDREIAEIKLDMLEKLLAETDDSFFFSIAGRKLFEPDGCIPSPTVKRLARNAGSVRAPFIAYETLFEVGECTTCHQWRKSTLNGKTFEDFVLSLRFFEGHIDRTVALSCGGLANQASKSNPTATTSAIRCEQIDQITGIKEYFVVDTEKNQGRWCSELSLDLATLITHRFEKISLARANFEKLQKSQEDENKRNQIESERIEVERKKLQIEKRQKDLLQRMAENKKGKATSSKDKSIKSPANLTTKECEATNITSGSTLLSVDAALNMHRDLTLNLLASSATRGEASVPVAAIVATRKKTMMNMKAAHALRRSAAEELTDDQIKSKIALAESAAVQKYTEEMNAVKNQSIAQQKTM